MRGAQRISGIFASLATKQTRFLAATRRDGAIWAHFCVARPRHTPGMPSGARLDLRPTPLRRIRDGGPGRLLSCRSPRESTCRTTCITRLISSSSPPAPPDRSIRCRALEKAGVGRVSRLPVSIRIVLESVLRNCDGKKVTEEHVRQLANWKPTRRARRRDPVRRRPRRAAGLHRRAAARRPGRDAQRGAATWARIRRRSSRWCRSTWSSTTRCMIDYYGTPDALDLNMKLEFQRNNERYQFMKWGMQAFDTFKVVPPGIGIVHQVNLEYLARGVHQQGRRLLPRHAGRHRQPHDDDQRHRRGRLGRGRHRGRGRHARPAGLLPHAGRRRRRAEGQAAPKASPRPTSC